MWRRSLVVVAVIACCAPSAVAEKVDLEIGVLTCALGDLGEAPPSDAPTGAQTRDALCTFKPKSGAEETYAAKVQGVSISADQKAALIWVVKSATGATIQPGLLQQSFTTDPKTPADQKPPMIGEPNTDIALHSMSDKTEGSASATQKPAPTGFVILSIELKLKSASG
jgi:Protein of unknown function (DUF992)